MKVLDDDWLLIGLQFIQVLESAHHLGRETTKQKDEDVDGNSDVGNETHDLVPVADTARSLCKVPATIFGDMLHLDLDFEQIGQEWEEWSKREGCREESDEA